MRTRISEPPESQYLRADEDQIAVGEPRRLLDEDPGAVSRSKITKPELPRALLDARVQWRHVWIGLETDVGIAAPDHGLTALEDVGASDASLVVEQRDPGLRLAPRREDALRRRTARASGDRRGLAAAHDLHRDALADAIPAPGAKQVDPLQVARAALYAHASTSGRDAGPAVAAKGKA